MALATLSKSLDPIDYAHLPDEIARVGHARNMFAGVSVVDHHHRVWEYSMMLAALGPRENIRGKKILDVGGSYAIFGGILAWGGATVTVNDVSDHSVGQGEIARRAVDDHGRAVPGGSMRFEQADYTHGIQETYDAIFCVSVIEHVGDDDKLIQTLLSAVRPGGVFGLTTDFHPSGVAQIGGHIRCYNGAMLDRWAATPGFVSEGGTDYADRGGHIFDRYNFASLVLRKS